MGHENLRFPETVVWMQTLPPLPLTTTLVRFFGFFRNPEPVSLVRYPRWGEQLLRFCARLLQCDTRTFGSPRPSSECTHTHNTHTHTHTHTRTHTKTTTTTRKRHFFQHRRVICRFALFFHDKQRENNANPYTTSLY